VPAVPRRFDYTVPDEAALVVGTRVKVPLQGRRVGGWVVADRVEPPEGVVAQPVTRLFGHGPPPALVELAEWAAWRWAGPVAAFLRTASPDRVVERLPSPAPRPVVPAVAEHPEVAAGPGRPRLVRLAPVEDPLPVVEAVIARAAGAPGGVLVLTPSVGWGERLAERLRRRGVPVARDWAEAAAGWPVVVGSRAAAWAPLPRLAAAVVLDAHDEAYREERAPTWNAWEVVAERAWRDGAPCVLVSPCPTVVQLSACDPWPPDRSTERAGWPALTVVDRRGADPRTGLYSEELVRLAGSSDPTAERPLVCVLNRTGRARLLACAACGELARCERCGRPVATSDKGLRCARCDLGRPAVCAACGGTRLKVLRPGVSRVREELAALLGRAVGEVTSAEPEVRAEAVLVGTEAVLHRVRRAAAVVFLDVDQHLLAPRFAAGEEALALLARAGRLVGGRRDGGVVMVQTRLPDHVVLAAAVHGDPGLVSAPELALRRALALPPAAALALASGPGAPELAAHLVGVEVAPLGDDRFLVRAPDHVELCDALAAAGRPKGRLRLEVDPTDV